MMKTIVEGALNFSFPADCQASKFDDWSFYRNQFQHVADGCKAVDIICFENDVSWLIEIKDYRHHRRTKAIDIADELAIKVRDTLAGLATAAKAANDGNERRHARKSLAAKRRWRVVLHLEQPTIPSRLRPRPIDHSALLLKLKTRKLKAVDAHPIVCDRSRPHSRIPWKVKLRP